MDIEFASYSGRVSRLGVMLSCVASLAVTSSARAQTQSPEDIASARTLGTEGVRLADSGDCAAAAPKLEAAEKLYHAPTTLERLGECQVNLGQLVAGTENLNRVSRETLPPSAPAAFIAAQRRATRLLATAQPKIGRLRIHVEGAPIDKVAVTVDGAGVPSALFDGERPTDPGAHVVTATAPGYTTATATVQLAESGSSTVSLKLDPAAGAPAGIPQSEPPSAGTAPSVAASATSVSATTAPNRVPALVAFGIGGVGLAVGSVFGITALGTKSSLDNACTNKICPASSQSDIDALSTRATISSIGFAVGIAGAAAGVVLLVTTRGETRLASAAVVPRRIRIAPWLGVGAAGLGGTFE